MHHIRVGQGPQLLLLYGLGSNLPAWAPVQAKRAQAAFPGAQLRWVERAGHYLHWDQPEEVARIIRESCG
ncbi:alpha/beta fold hydrolase [Sabulicella glaciei]|uniref:Alpha/beta hydrolase n=1 Tax=Sabulicella glaciei TaxID=2984948 RepID=A0ABT3P0Q0_9PROT|nr:hypothetical protein [Roseococcus sp. MDT2-1-1]MCW8087989.1 hypothetical protein [Roseococcus sp. MDT2-1-1]